MEGFTLAGLDQQSNAANLVTFAPSTVTSLLAKQEFTCPLSVLAVLVDLSY